VAVFWTSDGLHLAMSRDGGQNFAETERVALADPCECCATRALFADDGTLFCAYRDKADNQRDMFLLARRAAGEAWTRSRASGTPWVINGCPMTGNFLAAASGGPVMAWETKGIISFARFDLAGRKQGEETAASGQGGRYPVVLVAPDGVTCVSWK
jgi:hypothetical protein